MTMCQERQPRDGGGRVQSKEAEAKNASAQSGKTAEQNRQSWDLEVRTYREREQCSSARVATRTSSSQRTRVRRRGYVDGVVCSD
jgi:hypothetical protein